MQVGLQALSCKSILNTILKCSEQKYFKYSTKYKILDKKYL